jgi:Flp pilus assembly protein TadG
MDNQVRTSGRIRRERGASLVEFALIVPVFLMLLFGMITMGIALNDKQQMTAATREGARYAAAVPANQSFTSGTWASNVRDLIVERSVSTLSSGDICVSLVQGNPGVVVDGDAKYSTRIVSGSPQPCIANQTYATTSNDNGRRVQVTASRQNEIDLILFGRYPITLNAQATAKSESGS